MQFTRTELLSLSSPHLAAVRRVRITEGNFRLLTRMLTQIERILSINETEIVSVAIVEAARDSLVIGQT